MYNIPMKKIIIAGVILVGVFLFILLLILFFRANSKLSSPSAHPTPAISTPLPTVTKSQGRITISGVSVKDVLSSPQATTPQGDVLIVDKPHAYQIVYLKSTNSFLISILGSPFEPIRQQAEQQFLILLDISQVQACMLSVTITTPISANPNEAGKDYPLSFCNNIKNNSLSNITPGSTKESDVIATLGQPIAVATQNEFKVLSYPVIGENTTRTNKIYLQNGTVKYVVQEIISDNSLYTDYAAKQQKKEDGVLYDQGQVGSGFNWYIFAQDGIALLANKSNGYAIEVQHFPPMSYQDYLNTTAKTFSLSQTPFEGN